MVLQMPLDRRRVLAPLSSDGIIARLYPRTRVAATIKTATRSTFAWLTRPGLSSSPQLPRCSQQPSSATPSVPRLSLIGRPPPAPKSQLALPSAATAHPDVEALLRCCIAQASPRRSSIEKRLQHGVRSDYAVTEIPVEFAKSVVHGRDHGVWPAPSAQARIPPRL